MYHQIAGRKLGRTTSHRKALFANLVTSLVERERLETTLPKAKELRFFADHLITLGKKNNLAARQQAFRWVRSRVLVNKLFNELAPRFTDRQGGYTRIFRLGFRLGDASPMALIEYLPGKSPPSVPEKKSEKPKPKKKLEMKAAKTEKEKKGKEKETKAPEEKKSWFNKFFWKR